MIFCVLYFYYPIKVTPHCSKMNDYDIVECIFPFLYFSTSVSDYKQLCLVNKRFNKEFNDMQIIVSLNKWFCDFAATHFFESSTTSFVDYHRYNNIFRFQIIHKCYYSRAIHDVTLTIENGVGLLSIDSGNVKTVRESDDISIASSDDYSDEESSDSSDSDDECSNFYDRTIRTYQNIHNQSKMIEIIDKIIHSVYYY